MNRKGRSWAEDGAGEAARVRRACPGASRDPDAAEEGAEARSPRPGTRDPAWAPVCSGADTLLLLLPVPGRKIPPVNSE